MSQLDHKDIVAIARTYAQHQFDTGVECSASGIECMAKLSALCMTLIKNNLTTSVAVAQKIVDAKSPTELVELLTDQYPKRTDEALAFARQVGEIMNATNGELTRAIQQHAIDLNKRVTELLGELAASRAAFAQKGDFNWKGSFGDFPEIVTQMVETGKQMTDAWNDNLKRNARIVTPLPQTTGNQKDEEKFSARHART